MPDLKITEEIRSIINQCRFDGLKVYLPNIQLDRKLYVKVDTLLSEAGGKWSRKEKAHIFPEDPREKLGVLAAQDKLIDKQKLYQAFFTPPELAKRVVELADVEGCTVLEPSAGHGALIDQMLTYDGVEIEAIELNPEFVEHLYEKYGERIGLRDGDFLQLMSPESYYDRIIMNPPFTKLQWLKHIEHAYKFLKPGGKLVAITPNSLTNKKFQDFALDKKWEFEKIAGNTFEDTAIETNIVTIWK